MGDPTIRRKASDNASSTTNLNLKQNQIGHVLALEDPGLEALIVTLAIWVRRVLHHEVVDDLLDGREGFGSTLLLC